MRFNLLNLFKLKNSDWKGQDTNKVVIVKLDSIGDYVLFRNFLSEMKSKKFNNKKITLIGNSAWKQLALDLDSGFVDHFIWVDVGLYRTDIKYTKSLLKSLENERFDTLINPTYSASFTDTEIICRAIPAKEKLSFHGDMFNTHRLLKILSNTTYNQLYRVKNTTAFEFDINKEFFEWLIGGEIPLVKPRIDADNQSFTESGMVFNKPFVSFFLGAKAEFRRWGAKNFALLAQKIQNNYDVDIVILGGGGDVELAELFLREFDGRAINLVGKTNLTDLAVVFSQSSLLVSNDTAAPHMAIASGLKNIIVISNGHHYSRFVPYPEIQGLDYKSIFPISMKVVSESESNLIDKYRNGSTLDISEITVDDVFCEVVKSMNVQ